MRRLIWACALILLLPSPTFAGATLSLTTPDRVIAVGETTTITVSVQSDVALSVAAVRIAIPSGLSYVSHDIAGSVFDTEVRTTVQNTRLTIERARLDTGFTGNGIVFSFVVRMNESGLTKLSVVNSDSGLYPFSASGNLLQQAASLSLDRTGTSTPSPSLSPQSPMPSSPQQSNASATPTNYLSLPDTSESSDIVATIADTDQDGVGTQKPNAPSTLPSSQPTSSVVDTGESTNSSPNQIVDTTDLGTASVNASDPLVNASETSSVSTFYQSIPAQSDSPLLAYMLFFTAFLLMVAAYFFSSRKP
jgi:hypothetical protein